MRIGIAAVILFGAVVAGASMSQRASESRAVSEERAVARTLGAIDRPVRVAEDVGLDGIPIAPMGRRSNSALVSSPGYYPPDDPESLAVVRGRREVGPIASELIFAAPSAEELARRILAALPGEEIPSLIRVRISYDEYRDIVWPELPASRPITNIRVGEGWDNLLEESDAGMRRAAIDNAGRTLELTKVGYAKGALHYTNFRLLGGVQIHARTEAGADTVLDFAGTFIERNGRWKVFAYRD